MSRITDDTSLTQIYYLVNGKMHSVCRKYSLEKNYYLSQWYISIKEIIANYTNMDKSIYISVKNIIMNRKDADEDIDTTLRKTIQRDKVENYTFKCLCYGGIPKGSTAYEYTKGLFPELSENEEKVIKQCPTIAILEEELKDIVVKYNIIEKDLKQRALVSCTVLITILPGIPTEFTINDPGTSLHLISTNIHKLKKYIG